MIQKEASNRRLLRRRRIARLVSRLLKEIGDDPKREGLIETPERVAKAYEEWYKGYKDPDFVVKAFKTKYDGLVVRVGIPFQSFCEHHMARYAGVIHFAYIPNGYCIGLSKIIRLAQHWSAKLSIQEDLTDQISTQFREILKTEEVAVVVSALHTCESTRGVKVAGVPTITSKLTGRFFDDHKLRDEFYKLIELTSNV